MPLFKLNLSILCASLLLSATAFAGKSNEIDTLLATSGLTAQTADLTAQFYQGIEQGVAESGAPQSIGDNIRAKIGDSLDAQRIGANLRRALDANMSLKSVRKLNRWYATELAQKITELEVVASSIEQSNFVTQNLDTLLGNHEKVAMARRVEEVIRGGKLAATMLKTMQITLISSLMQDAPADQRQMVLQQTEQQIEAMMPQLTELMLASYVHTYSSLSTKELDSYLDFLATPEATQFYQVTLDAIGETLGEAITQLSIDAQE